MNAFIIFAILAVVAFIVFALIFMYQLRTYEKPLEQETHEDMAFCEAVEEPFSKDKVYKYQTPFDDKLIELGVKEKWDANREALLRSDYIIPLKTDSFFEFIDFSFFWSTSVEGFDFWNEISKK